MDRYKIALRYQHINRRLYMLRRRYGKKTFFAADGEHQAIGAQLEFFDAGCFPKLLIKGKVSVLVVADNRIADTGKVDTDLMHPAGMQPNGKQAIGIRTCEKLIRA